MLIHIKIKINKRIFNLLSIINTYSKNKYKIDLKYFLAYLSNYIKYIVNFIKFLSLLFLK